MPSSHVFSVDVAAAVLRIASVIEAEDLSAGITCEGQEICQVVHERPHSEGARERRQELELEPNREIGGVVVFYRAKKRCSEMCQIVESGSQGDGQIFCSLCGNSYSGSVYIQYAA